MTATCMLVSWIRLARFEEARRLGFEFQTASWFQTRTGAAPQRPVIPRHRVSPPASPMTGSSGVSSTPRLLDSVTGTSEYWIARRSLSSGGHSADPLAGDDD